MDMKVLDKLINIVKPYWERYKSLDTDWRTDLIYMVAFMLLLVFEPFTTKWYITLAPTVILIILGTLYERKLRKNGK